MEETKQWWKSKTVWGGILSIAAVAISGTELACGEPTGVLSELQQNVDSILAGVGGLLAIGGRISAEQKIGPAPKTTEQ